MKKIYRITEGDLKRIVSSSVVKLLKEYQIGNLVLDAENTMQVSFIGRDKILSIADEIYSMLCAAYEDIGGLNTYSSKDDFLRKARFAKVVFNGQSLIACAMYRKMEDSYKMVAIGSDQSIDGKIAVQSIIKSDIENLHAHFWAEVSGAVEHYFKKFNGFPIPNILASSVLRLPPDRIRVSTKDKVHYERTLGQTNEWFEKAIYGIRDEATYESAINAIEDYSTFMKEVNTIKEENVLGLKYTLKQALYIIENIYRENEENGFYELIPSWYEALIECLKTLKASEQTETVTTYIEYCNDLLETMPLLELHPIIE